MKEMIASQVAHPQTFQQKSSWYNALTLSERLRSFRSQKSDAQVLSHKKSEIAARRLHKWKTQSPFTKDLYFMSA